MKPETVSNNIEVTVIGPAIVDVIAGPIGEDIFKKGSMPMDEVRMTYGGNAHNEAVVLSRLGVRTLLVSKVGDDEVGTKLIEHLKNEDVDTEAVVKQEGLSTGINVVLYDGCGERRFLTNPKGSLRKFSEEDAIFKIEKFGKIVSFSCMFVSPLIDICAMERIFRKIKERPDTTLVVDMVKPKNGEKIEDLRPVLKYIDYFLPNSEELFLLSDVQTPVLDRRKKESEIVSSLLSYGVKHIIVKGGKEGCRIYEDSRFSIIPAYESAAVTDTTGAGDSFVSGFIYGLTNNMSLEECARFANATASCCVEKAGATEGILSIDKPMERYLKMKSNS